MYRARDHRHGLGSKSSWIRPYFHKCVWYRWRGNSGKYESTTISIFLTKTPKTTASDAVLTAVVAARSLYQRNHPDIDMEDLVIYTTTQTHSLGAKAGLILGIKVKALEVRFEDQLSLRGATLRKALEEDIGSGIHPFIMSKSFCLSYWIPSTKLTGANLNLQHLCRWLFDLTFGYPVSHASNSTYMEVTLNA